MNDKNIVFERYADIGEKIVFPAFDHNCLYSMEKSTKKVELLGVIPINKLLGYRSFFSVEVYKKKIILVPFDSNSIVIYDMENRNFQVIELEKASSFQDIDFRIENAKFAYSTVWENKIFMFPHSYPALVILDLDIYELVYDTKFVKNVVAERINNEPYVTDIYVIGSKVYGSLGCRNAVVVYDMSSRVLDIINISDKCNGFNGIIVDGCNIVLAPRLQGAIIIYNQDSGMVEEYDNYPKEFMHESIPFHTIYKVDEGYVFIPGLTSEMILLDIRRKELLDLSVVSMVLRKRFNPLYSYERLLAFGREKDIIWFMSGVELLLYEYSISDNTIKSSRLTCKDCPIKERDIVYESLKNHPGDILMENDCYGLHELFILIDDK